MNEITLFLWLVAIAGGVCCLFGVLFVVNPQVIHKANQAISFSILSFDATFMKYNRYTGLSFLAIGIVLLYFIIRIL